MARQIIGDTGRTAIDADGKSERIYEAYIVGGMFDGATFEVLESEIKPGELAGFPTTEGE